MCSIPHCSGALHWCDLGWYGLKRFPHCEDKIDNLALKAPSKGAVVGTW